jgi:hypothetical protein
MDLGDEYYNLILSLTEEGTLPLHLRPIYISMDIVPSANGGVPLSSNEQ